MPVIDENRIIGNFGSNLVAHILSKMCLVRPVAEGTDIGIDLYCEAIEERQGFLHFWVQVKCGKQITIENNDLASCRFKVDHLRYWHRQPVPVLAFYVPTSFPPEIPNQIFVANITEYVMKHGFKKGKMNKVESYFKISPGVYDWYGEFKQRLKATTALIKFRDDGIFSNLPELEPKYTMQYRQLVGSSRDAKESLRTIRSTVSSLIIDAALLKHNESIAPPKKFFKKRLLKILQIFEEGKRPEIMKASALWNAIIERDPKKAKTMVENAFKSIDGDPNLNESIREKWKKEFDPVLEIINDMVASQQGMRNEGRS